jgi:hypothetical protein
MDLHNDLTKSKEEKRREERETHDKKISYAATGP